ncbi:PREDICTED: cyclin-dependent kinase inhibitor 2 isoform X2 [Tarenaya hassleriana]|uniref:cyclin-dependent kinase inhibitor 2 isoform X2 n=1 Tax=Tarenaya hassleriana TaxID=28532 RepID=UPI0008FD862E|nr:PREDICTED: cyclin-dependent kinase inhibitor 2 isoform X2 [Tarenaya hassleriana]
MFDFSRFPIPHLRFECGFLQQYNVAGKGTSWNCSSSASEENEESESVEVKASEAAESCGRSTVTEAELEAFFMAEKDLRYKILEYSSKYNFDFVKEEALDGRYEWVKLKP